MLDQSTLVFTYSFTGTKVPLIWSRIYEEYVSLSSKTKLIVVADEITSEQQENLSLIKIPKSSLPIIQVLNRALRCLIVGINQRKNYDLVFIRILDLSYLTAGILAKKILKKKMIVWLSNSEIGHTGIRRKIYKIVVKKALTIADAIGSSSEKVVKDMEDFVGLDIDRRKVTLIKQGVNLKRFKSEPVLNEEDSILCVARIQKIKGIENIIQAIPYVIESIPDVKLKVVGTIVDFNYFENLKELASNLHCKKYIEFVGPIPYDKIVQFYNSSKLFVLTSRGEGHSNVTYEAMACEKPVIVVPSGNHTELIEDGVNGFLVEKNQAKVLAQKIVELLEDKSCRDKIGKAARKTMENECDWGSFIDNLAKLFNKVKSNSFP